MSDPVDFNLEQMKKLLGCDNVTIVYLWAHADYWIRPQEFCQQFRQTDLSHHVVIHVQFEALSLTHAGVVTAVQKIMAETGRDSATVWIFSPNSIAEDSPWPNLFWRRWPVSDEFLRSETYWCDAPALDVDARPWALFIGRKTTPRLLALYDIWQNAKLRSQCVLSVLEQVEPETVQIFDFAQNTHDQLSLWLPPVDNPTHEDFRVFCRSLPIGSIDGFNIHDQYCRNQNSQDDRNFVLPRSLINLGRKYLFEITFETMTLGTTFTPSEKTIRTIVAKKPLVVYAPRNFLLNLRDLGFRTFEDLWDESYDQLEGPPRYQAIMKIVQETANLSRPAQLKLHQAGQIVCEHNHDMLKKIKNKKFP